MIFNKRKYVYGITGFLLLAFVLPNTINFRERNAFSDDVRLKQARSLSPVGDSITVVAGDYYKRSSFYTFFLGKKNRELWTTPVKTKVLDLDSVHGGLVPYAIGGSQQTISVRLSDSVGRHWVLRSVNKDQENALPGLLKYSLLRSMFRDQVAAMNPYAPLVVAELAGAANLPHCSPTLLWVPYNEKYGTYNQRMAGRMVYLEEQLDSTWKQFNQLNNVIDIFDTNGMLLSEVKQKTGIDTLLYLKTRLFDMLICDWDRHSDQWRWALIQENGKRVFKPIAKDRDMSFYIFDEGVFSQLTLAVNSKFQSFRKEYKNVHGLTKQARNIDTKILRGIPQSQFITQAKEIQSQLGYAVIEKSFQQYPTPIYAKVGKLHRDILQSRLDKLTVAAEQFYQLINK
jgi:hypothetical protein